MPENCLFCLEPVGVKDLAVPNLPCMCRTPQHDACREKWNQMNPYRCPICRKTFKPDVRSPAPAPVQATAPPYDLRTGPDMMFMNPVEGSTYQNQSVYVPMPTAPPAPQPASQTQPNNNERMKKAFAICFTILICAFLFIIVKAIFS